MTEFSGIEQHGLAKQLYKSLDASEISDRLAQQAEIVAAYLLPNGRRRNGKWICGNVYGDQGESLSILLQQRGKSAPGQWKDFQTEEGGDLLDLWAANRGTDLSGAYREASDWLGLSSEQKPFHTPSEPTKRQSSSMRHAHTWHYPEKDGISGKTVREENSQGQKQVYPYFRRDGKIGIEKGYVPPLYGKPSESTFWVEGEKCVDPLLQMGLAAVTSQGGSGAAQKADLSGLEHLETVYFLPDNDEAGMKYMSAISTRLRDQYPDIRILHIELDGLPPKGDIVDWIQARVLGWDGYAKDKRIAGLKDELRDLSKIAESVEPSVTWPEFISLDTAIVAQLDVSLLPGWAGKFAHALSQASETPPELAFAMVLSACSTASARRVNVMVKPGYFETLCIWILAALLSGSRKSYVQGAATAPLLVWEHDQSEILEPEIKQAVSNRKTMEARAKELRNKAAKHKDVQEAYFLAEEAAQIEADVPEIPVRPQLWTSDATPERLGTLLAEQDECIAWLSSEGGVFDLLGGRYSKGIPNLDLALKAHNGDPEKVDRGSRPPVNLRYPRLTVGLSPQPSVLRGLANRPGFRGRGLLARFLYLLPTSNLGYRTLETTPVPESLIAEYSSGLQAMLNWEPAQDSLGREHLHHLHLSPEAFNEYLAFAHKVEAGMRPGGGLEHITDWAGKAPGAAARVAGVLHCIEYAHSRPWEHKISVETMDSALSIMTVITEHTLAAMDLMGADASIEAARYVWAWIERSRLPLFTIREAFQSLKGTFPRTQNLVMALNVLEERGYLEIMDSERRDGPGRRASPSVMVRPEIVSQWS